MLLKWVLHLLVRESQDDVEIDIGVASPTIVVIGGLSANYHFDDKNGFIDIEVMDIISTLTPIAISSSYSSSSSSPASSSS